MSRAFVREQDNILPEGPPELELGDGPNFVTPAGLEQIDGKVTLLQAELARTSDEATRNTLSRDLRYWSARQATAQVVVPKNAESVEFGTRVTIERRGKRQIFEIVGTDEAHPNEGRLNWQAPLAAALLGARIGETVTLENHSPAEEITILGIEIPRSIHF